jgi:hypothetical protein
VGRAHPNGRSRWGPGNLTWKFNVGARELRERCAGGALRLDPAVRVRPGGVVCEGACAQLDPAPSCRPSPARPAAGACVR